MSRKRASSFVCALFVVSAFAFMLKTSTLMSMDAEGTTQILKSGDAAKPEMTDAEKRASWIGQKVTLLGTTALACPIQGKGELFFLHGNEKKDKRFPASVYAGQTGVIEEAAMSSTALPEIAIRLDKSGEKVFCSGDQGLGFHSELEEVRKMEGCSLWSKGPQTLTPDNQLCLGLGERTGPRVELKNLQKVTVTRVEFGHHLQPIYLLLKTEDGEEGWLTGWDAYDYFVERFYIKSAGTVATRHYSYRFYTEDPRKPHPDWKDADWKLIENNEVAIGMTEEMARMACGREIKPVDSTPSQPGVEAPAVYECNCEKFLVEKGIVTKFVEIPEPKLVQTSNGFDIAILSIDRKGNRWEDRTRMMVYKAKKKGEVIVIRFRVKRVGDQKKFEINRPELLGFDGVKADSPTLSFSTDFSQSCRISEFDLPFGVVKGSRLKTLRIGDVTFDLEKLESK